MALIKQIFNTQMTFYAFKKNDGLLKNPVLKEMYFLQIHKIGTRKMAKLWK